MSYGEDAPDVEVTEAELAATDTVGLPREVRREILLRHKRGETISQIVDVMELPRSRVRAVVDPNYQVNRGPRPYAVKKTEGEAVKRVEGETVKKADKKPAVVVDPVDRALNILNKGKGFIEIKDLGEEATEVLVALEHRGYNLSLANGVIRLEKNPQALVNDAPVRGLFDPTRTIHRFAVITDTHIGGYQFQYGFVKEIFEEAERRGCRFVAHAGDHVDGATKMHAGFEYELALTRAEDQANAAAEVYRECGLPLIGIGGNHDGSFHKSVGLDVCSMIARRAEQFKYIGPIEGWIEGPNGDPNFIRLFHPGDGCSYALSYKDQKTAEFLALSGEKVPSGFHFTGHYHKYNVMRGPNGARYFLAPAACGITDFMKAKRLINHAGALFVEFTLDHRGRVDRCMVEDVVLAPDLWTRCDYSTLLKRGKRQSASISGVWAG